MQEDIRKHGLTKMLNHWGVLRLYANLDPNECQIPSSIKTLIATSKGKNDLSSQWVRLKNGLELSLVVQEESNIEDVEVHVYWDGGQDNDGEMEKSAIAFCDCLKDLIGGTCTSPSLCFGAVEITQHNPYPDFPKSTRKAITIRSGLALERNKKELENVLREVQFLDVLTEKDSANVKHRKGTK